MPSVMAKQTGGEVVPRARGGCHKRVGGCSCGAGGTPALAGTGDDFYNGQGGHAEEEVQRCKGMADV